MILAAASRFEFAEIEKKCAELLQTFLEEKPLNCLRYNFLASLYNFKELKICSMNLMCSLFMDIKDDKYFLILESEISTSAQKIDFLLTDVVTC